MCWFVMALLLVVCAPLVRAILWYAMLIWLYRRAESGEGRVLMTEERIWRLCKDLQQQYEEETGEKMNKAQEAILFAYTEAWVADLEEKDKFFAYDGGGKNIQHVEELP